MKMMGPMDSVPGSGDLTSDVQSRYVTANRQSAPAADANMKGEWTGVMGANSLKSHKVVDEAGNDIGKIEEVMIDLGNGGILYAVLSHGSFMGIGGKLVAVPWQAFTVDTMNEQLVLAVSKDKLDAAPHFDNGSWPDMTKEEFRSQIHGYYGI